MELNKESNGFLDCMKMLDFQPAGYGGLRVRYGKVYNYSLKEYKDAYDGLCDEYERHATYEEFLMWVDETQYRADLNAADELESYAKRIAQQEEEQRKQEHAKELVRKYRAEFENACDDLYYGYGYKFWREHNNGIDNEEDAKLVWNAAFNKMAKA